MDVPEEQTGIVVIPEGEKLIYKSELFDVIVRAKQRHRGIVRDRFLVAVELLENDPALERVALLDVPEQVWKDVEVGEKVQARLYEHPDRKWSSRPPVGVL